jgi:nucleotide-binding universal stress UspA family protein
MKAATLPELEDQPKAVPSEPEPFKALAYDRILAPTDFSEPSLKALDYALALASPTGANIRMIHVLEPSADYLNFDTLSVLRPDEEAEIQCQEELQRLATERRHNRANITWKVGVGRPAAEIVQAAKDFHAELLVVSTHGRTGLKHLLLGSVAERIVRYAPCPVLIVRKHEREIMPPPEFHSIGLNVHRILVPTDFSPRSLASVRYAARFARAFGGKITLFHSLNLYSGFVPSEYPVIDGSTFRAAEEAVKKEAERYLRECVPDDLADEAIVQAGPPLSEIPAFAEEGKFDLIICATHSAAPLQHVLLGSTAEQIIRHAGCPVLVVGDNAMA